MILAYPELFASINTFTAKTNLVCPSGRGRAGQRALKPAKILYRMEFNKVHSPHLVPLMRDTKHKGRQTDSLNINIQYVEEDPVVVTTTLD